MEWEKVIFTNPGLKFSQKILWLVIFQCRVISRTTLDNFIQVINAMNIFGKNFYLVKMEIVDFLCRFFFWKFKNQTISYLNIFCLELISRQKNTKNWIRPDRKGFTKKIYLVEDADLLLDLSLCALGAPVSIRDGFPCMNLISWTVSM